MERFKITIVHTQKVVSLKLTLVLLLLFFCSSIQAESILTFQSFAERYIQAARNKYPDIKVTKKSNSEIAFKLKDSEQIAYLDNAYLSYKNNPAELDAIINNHVGLLGQLLNKQETTLSKSKILPVIKDVNYINQVNEVMKKKGNEDAPQLVMEQLNSYLYVLYVFDTETSMRFMTTKDLAELELKESGLRALAKGNLKAAIPNLRLEGDPAFLSMIIADGVYEASFLLFDDLWTKEKFPVNGDIVVYVPSRDAVLITGSKDNEGLERIKNIINAPDAQWPYMISEQGFIRKGGQWEVFQP